ncbi:MAG: polysaccharide deacetylase family protein [Firmicutes bacterium]|nr:polysaccharide deacetylase family protein [Bacillota bacterium]
MVKKLSFMLLFACFLTAVFGISVFAETKAARIEGNIGEHKVYAYDVGGFKYIAAEDVALLLSGTDASFDIFTDYANWEMGIQDGKYTNTATTDASAPYSAEPVTGYITLLNTAEKTDLPCIKVNGKFYIKIKEFADVLGLTLSWQDASYSLYFYKNGVEKAHLTLVPSKKPGRIVDPQKPMIALTFDDGPRAGSTELIVDALKKVDGRATFFVVGSMVDANPSLVKKAVEAGCQIGNHTYDHANLVTLGADAIKYQVNKTSNSVYTATGIYPMIGRPPYGSVNSKVRDAVSIPWFNWDVDTLDWKYRDADYVYNTVIKNAKDGCVILMHDLHPTTAQAMVRAIPKLDEMGFQLVTIDEMAKAKGGYAKVPGYIS